MTAPDTQLWMFLSFMFVPINSFLKYHINAKIQWPAGRFLCGCFRKIHFSKLNNGLSFEKWVCSEGVLEPAGVCVWLGCFSLAAEGWCCVVVPGSERQVPGAGHRGHAQGAGVPVHRGADSAAGSHLPPPVWAHLVSAGKGTDLPVLPPIQIWAFMDFSDTQVRLTDTRVQVDKMCQNPRSHTGSLSLGQWLQGAGLLPWWYVQH